MVMRGNIQRKNFISPSKGKMRMEEVVADIVGFIQEEPDAAYRVIIGTDSQTKKNGEGLELDFVTAVVVHRVGRGGRYFYIREKEQKYSSDISPYRLLRDKIYSETLRSISLARVFVPLLRSKIPVWQDFLEIHIDIGSAGVTREMIRELVGMVTGSGYVARTKPNSYGASIVADRHT